MSLVAINLDQFLPRPLIMFSLLSSTISSMFEPESSKERILLILVGLVGSGKSTFAEALQEHFPQFRRCNQDDLGNRRNVEDLARDSLRQGYSVCIDRTNFNESQRSYWIDIAHEFPGTLIWVIVFDTPYEICASRLRERTSHPTIKSPEQGLDVLSRFASDFVPPMNHEGYQRCLRLTPDQTQLHYSQADIAAILERIRTSVPVLSESRSASGKASGHSRSAPRGSRPYSYYPGNRGGRGGGGGGGYRRGIRGGYMRSQRGVDAPASASSESIPPPQSQSQTRASEPAGQSGEEDHRQPGL